MKSVSLLILLGCSIYAKAQYENGFAYGKITYDEFNNKSFSPDTSAHAIVLNEFGEGFYRQRG